jgi:hypothetical protein
MHRRPDLYGMDAELFRPERWDGDMLLNHDETNTKWGYLPFNGGPRICLGSKVLPFHVSKSYFILTDISGLCTCRSSIYDTAHRSKIPHYQAS